MSSHAIAGTLTSIRYVGQCPTSNGNDFVYKVLWSNGQTTDEKHSTLNVTRQSCKTFLRRLRKKKEAVFQRVPPSVQAINHRGIVRAVKQLVNYDAMKNDTDFYYLVQWANGNYTIEQHQSFCNNAIKDFLKKVRHTAPRTKGFCLALGYGGSSNAIPATTREVARGWQCQCSSQMTDEDPCLKPFRLRYSEQGGRFCTLFALFNVLRVPLDDAECKRLSKFCASGVIDFPTLLKAQKYMYPNHIDDGEPMLHIISWSVAVMTPPPTITSLLDASETFIDVRVLVSDGLHTIAVDCDRRHIFDSKEEYVMHLDEDTLKECLDFQSPDLTCLYVIEVPI